MSADDEHDLVPDWAADLADTGHAELTSRRYVSAVRAFLIWFADQNHEPFTPARLTPIDLTGYTQQLQRTSKHGERACLRPTLILRLADRQRLC